MKKTLLLIFLMGSLVRGHAQLEHDKALHFIGGNLFGLAGAGIAKQLSDGDRFWTFAGAVGGSALIGMGKEAIDAGQRENGWDNEDLLATVLGGLTVGLTIELVTAKKRKSRPQTAVNQALVLSQEYNILYLNSGSNMPSWAELHHPQIYLALQMGNLRLKTMHP